MDPPLAGLPVPALTDTHIGPTRSTPPSRLISIKVFNIFGQELENLLKEKQGLGLS